MSSPWETELAEFLTSLMAVQDETLGVLTKKCELLAKADSVGLAELEPREAELVSRLQACLTRRGELLEQASQEGLPADSIQSLTKSLPSGRHGELPSRVKLAKARARLLQHRSLTNWVVAQKTLLHLSQMLEIIATRGRGKPTYDRGEPVAAGGGALVDQEA